jgi:hypothetical protein
LVAADGPLRGPPLNRGVMPKEMDDYVAIHGDKWKWADIQESVEWARLQQWEKRKWVARPALVSKEGISDFVGIHARTR